MTTETSKRKPIHKIARSGIHLAIWKNDGPKGVWYSVTLERVFKKGEQWGESNSFGEDDLLRLSKITDEADTWIQNARQAGRRAEAA
jgi:hypothetical protein